MPWAPWELALCPSSLGVFPALHVANRLITSGLTDWNSICVPRGTGLGRPARILPSRPLPPRQPFSAWPLLCWAASRSSEDWEAGRNLSLFLRFSQPQGPCGEHLLVGKAWVAEKTSRSKARSDFRSLKGLPLSYHHGKFISEEPGQAGAAQGQARFPPPAHESQLLVRGRGSHHGVEAVCSCVDRLAKARSQGTGLRVTAFLALSA